MSFVLALALVLIHTLSLLCTVQPGHLEVLRGLNERKPKRLAQQDAEGSNPQEGWTTRPHARCSSAESLR